MDYVTLSAEIYFILPLVILERLEKLPQPRLFTDGAHAVSGKWFMNAAMFNMKQH